MKRRLFLIASAFALALAACGGAQPTTAPKAEEPKPAAPTEAPKAAAPTEAPKAAAPTEAPKAAAPTEAPKAEAPKAAEIDKSKLAKELNIYTWDGYFDQAVLDDFEKEIGVKVNIETYDANETMYNKFKAGGNPGYDIVVPSDYMVEIMAREGMLEKLDYANIPNVANIDAGHRGLYFDPNNEYTVAHNWGTTGIAYDSEKLEIKSWKDVFDPNDDLKKKLECNDKGEGCRIGLLDDPRETIGAALRYLGYSGSTTNLDEVKKATELLASKKAQFSGINTSSDFKGLLAKGEVLAAMMYGNDAVFASKDKPSIKYVIPEGVTSIWQDNVCIPKGGKSKYTAEVFINWLLKPEVAAKNANALGLSMSNAAAAKAGLIDAKLLADKNIYPDDIAGKVKAKQLEWLLRFGDDKVTAAYDEAYTATLAK
jgi:spermidine/putrescine transport system substrate-binding protein